MCNRAQQDFGANAGGGAALFSYQRDNRNNGNSTGGAYQPPYESEIDKASHTAMQSRLQRRRKLRGQSLLAAGAPESDAATALPYATGKDTLGA